MVPKVVSSILGLVKTYPARTVASLNAALGVALAFDIALTTAQIGAINGFLAVLLGVGVHGAVTPNGRVAKRVAPPK